MRDSRYGEGKTVLHPTPRFETTQIMSTLSVPPPAVDSVLAPAVWMRSQSLLLRVGACIEMLAFPWAVAPRAWMEASHEWLGMGTMPSGAVVDFTIRQSAFFYGMHGVLLWWLAGDVVRFQPIVRLIGWTYLIFGPVFFLIDWTTGTPLWWTWCDPLATGAFGALILVFDRRITTDLRHAASNHA
jgi:hypothetical protein